MQNQIVARYRDGRIVKGTATNFSPQRERFHVLRESGPVEVGLAELKALFFVRDLVGDARYEERKTFERPQPGRRMVCELADGEVLVGYVVGYDPKRLGFFLVPDDPGSNNERIFVVNAAVKKVTFQR